VGFGVTDTPQEATFASSGSPVSPVGEFGDLIALSAYQTGMAPTGWAVLMNFL
jgi:hypothetical protein